MGNDYYFVLITLQYLPKTCTFKYVIHSKKKYLNRALNFLVLKIALMYLKKHFIEIALKIKNKWKSRKHVQNQMENI